MEEGPTPVTATHLQFTATELTLEERSLQQEVREFLDMELPPGSTEPGLGMAAGSSPEFSRKLAARGWVGMALPKEYGGGDRTAVERFIVVEELLRRGAPLEHHWTADRQYGPLIYRYGTETQKRYFLPQICRGEISFCIGMSEPDAGSDLASVKSRAVRAEGGWVSDGHQDLDQQRPPRRLLRRPVPDRRSTRPPPRSQPADRRLAQRRGNHQPHTILGWHFGVQRGRLRQRVRAR